MEERDRGISHIRSKLHMIYTHMYAYIYIYIKQ
jgi:hypothetical protein